MPLSCVLKSPSIVKLHISRVLLFLNYLCLIHIETKLKYELFLFQNSHVKILKRKWIHPIAKQIHSTEKAKQTNKPKQSQSSDVIFLNIYVQQLLYHHQLLSSMVTEQEAIS